MKNSKFEFLAALISQQRLLEAESALNAHRIQFGATYWSAETEMGLVNSRASSEDVRTLSELQAVMMHIKTIETTNLEIRLAADMEFAAQQLNVDMDAGESLLCATLINRKGDYIFTGDKRALIALQALLESGDASAEIQYKVTRLEQLLLLFLEKEGHASVQAAVCTDEIIDRALTNCFTCRSSYSKVESWREGLLSYIRDLQTKAPKVLSEYIS